MADEVDADTLDVSDRDTCVRREGDELPVVARLVVEIRSDGSRTIARGAIEDCVEDRQVAVEARADSPLELSRALARMLLTVPFTAGSALLGGTRARADTPARNPGLRGLAGALGRRVGRAIEHRLLGSEDE